MRHRKAGRKLGRTWEHRKAMMKNMASSLVIHEKIKTTEYKAKELRKVADRLVAYGLKNTVHARRNAYKILEDRTLVKKLFDEIAPRFNNASGGYTRIFKLAKPRKGDAAPMAIVDWSVDSKEVRKD
ncbi:MAG TPA: 50S ribosomal protein L17 [Desulfohalobiaceae bacterium]|nr:50S ribosomal protein L17 [Desulfohalobiaceae bacterium]